MKLANIAQNALILSILGVFLTGSTLKAMEVKVAMNEGKTITLAPKDSLTLATDQLKGCVVTLLHIEHANGQRTVTMCHFSHDRKSDNESYLNRIVTKLTQKNISKMSCCIIAPGIKEFNHIKPILDPEWKDLITNAIRKSFPSTTIAIRSYLFNIKDSTVQYNIDQREQKIIILDHSSQEDTQNTNQLLLCHNIIQPSFCQRWLPLLITGTGMAAYLAYQMQ